MSAADAWRARARTLEAMAELVVARMIVAWVPLPRWPGRFALPGSANEAQMREAARLAAHVRRGAGRLPFESKCLPQALALSRMARRRAVPHSLVIAARPLGARSGMDDLHAWIEVGGRIVLGEIPGPWIRVLALPEEKPGLVTTAGLRDK